MQQPGWIARELSVNNTITTGYIHYDTIYVKFLKLQKGRTVIARSKGLRQGEKDEDNLQDTP